jgi:aryl-alcohol dehydrogenase-like predicted oxidoreductase
MKTRRLGYSDEHVTTMGLGTWALGGGDWAFTWGEQEDATSVRVIHRALDLGINWIDTAPLYGLGHAEKVVGRAIEGRRDEVFVATKCGLVWDEPGATPFHRLTAASVRLECEQSLRRLGTDVIDLYQIHRPRPAEEIEEAWTAIAELIEEGKVRYGGVSNFDIDHLERARRIHPVASLQSPYSMLRRGIESELLSYCAEHDIGVLTYSPMLSGMLTGKFSKARVEQLGKDDWRRENRAFTEPRLSVNLAFVEQLRPIAERIGLTLPQLAIAWVLRRDEVTAAIVGARRPSQIEGTAAAADWTLSEEDVAEIDRLLAERDAVLSDPAAV